MDPLSQAVIGATAAQAISRQTETRNAFWIGGLSGMAPDLDVLIRSSTDPLLSLEYHRQFSHSLFFIPIGAMLCAVCAYPIAKKYLSFAKTYLFSLLGLGTHGLLDSCTTYGTQLLWPFSEARIAWHNISVIDPLLTVPLLAIGITASMLRSSRLAAFGGCWAIIYLAFGLVQHHRALEAADQLASSRNHYPIRLETKPSFGNLIVWKTIYEFEDQFFVDAIRVGVTPSMFEGESAKKLKTARDFEWLNPNSQQSIDIERFRWFSDNWLTLDPKDRSLIIDARYSLLPNSVKGLWGIRVREIQENESHVQWVVKREATDSDLAFFWQQIMGTRALPIPDKPQ